MPAHRSAFRHTGVLLGDFVSWWQFLFRVVPVLKISPNLLHFPGQAKQLILIMRSYLVLLSCHFMIYKIRKNSELFPAEITVQSTEEFLFVLEFFSISVAEKLIVITAYPETNFIYEKFSSIGIHCKRDENNFYFSKSEITSIKKITADFSENPVAAIPFSICCAVNNIQADIKGLNSLANFDGIDVISLLQRGLYRFNINTDFCDQSKLKMYNNKLIQKKTKPADVSASDLLSLFFIPLAVNFDEMEIELHENFFEKYNWAEKALPFMGFDFLKP